MFKGEKAIFFSTLPGSHLSSGCHDNSDVVKVARVIFGSLPACQELEVSSRA